MKTPSGERADIVLVGVGGQGVLMGARILAEAGLREGRTVRQGELHGMSQRGGDVRATLRMADGPITTDLVGRGGASLLLGLEPLEALRNVSFLSPDGRLVASTTPVRNMAHYPDPDEIRYTLARHPGALLVDAGGLAREAGSARAANVVLLGAAVHLLPVSPDTLEAVIGEAFRPRGEKLVETNRRAFRAGRAAAAAAASTVT